MSSRILRMIFGALCFIGAGLSVFLIFVVLVSGLPGIPHAAWGTVVGYERELTGRSLDSLRYFPIVTYTDSFGVTRSFRSWSGLAQRSYATGEVIRVPYSSSENPKMRQAEIASAASRWGTRVWLFWVLAVLAFVSIVPLTVVAYALVNGRGIREVISSFRRAPKAA